MARIGVFVCHCGENIARTVNCAKVAEEAAKMPGVVYALDYKYMCSDPGQEIILKAIKEHRLTSVVVAACSPHMHEKTFRGTASRGGLNPYMCEQANIREHCSWVHESIPEGTDKAIDIVRTLVAKVMRDQPLDVIKVPVTKRCMVIGGGIAGIQAALDVAAAGYEVVLVERQASIGGHMSQLSETFPTLDCSQCILTPRMVEVAQHPKIKLYTFSEVEAVSGYVGNFKVKIRRKARYVKEEVCIRCGLCTQKCPAKKIPNEFNCGLDNRTAIHVPFPQAVPNIPRIDRENCTWFQKGKCGVCKKICPVNAVDYEMEDKIVEEDIGAIVVATGYELYDIAGNDPNGLYSGYGEYGKGKYADVIDGLQFERLASASGPTGGEIRRPSDGKEPKTIAFLACIGSRDNQKGISFCSNICCMYLAKHAMLYEHKVHGGKGYIFYMDIRSGGKSYDEFVRRAVEEDHVCYVRGRVSKVYKRGDKIVLRGTDTLLGRPIELEADMVVLATAVTPSPGVEKLAQMLGIPYDKYKFLSEAHPKLRPVETVTAGIYLAGCCQGPKDIPLTVAQASGAASKVLALLSRSELEREPTVAKVDETTCVACWCCYEVCPYNAIEKKEIRDRKGNLIKMVANVNRGLCQGCGLCAATCRSGSIDLAGFNDEQLMAEIEALAQVR
ncbi:MAG TPA: CoB--CoM heterodisulfide reductase iron-sulfur subunit A family protein [Candidatus Brocadiia bacterium]|nr:CoB--CoM heterodisulfide reductase iron-sulfur subunit A family protein [Candidatus Brocadiia bacterium]